MRSIQILGWACLTVLSGAAAAQNTAEQEPLRMAARSAPAPDVSTVWVPRRADPVPGIDRLRYLSGFRCADRPGCAKPLMAARSPAAPAEYEYIDSLDLGTYGPVRFKFTGDRVKLQVKF
ncbi:MAG: hypothetical protein U5R46_14155 [Gammaproteobacteria bacterium]|nr:hypothetical protein [Gammaproteobacteria bacterium]